MKYTSFTKSLLVSALVIGASFVQNVQAQCFDMTASIGTDSNIQFRNYDVQYNTQTGYYDWVMTNPRAAGFPRHTLMTAAGQDALVPALSVLPPNGIQYYALRIRMSRLIYTPKERCWRSITPLQKRILLCI